MFINKMKTKIPHAFSVFLISIIFLTQPLHSQWYWQSPVPSGNELQGIKFLNNQTGYITGVLGSIMKTTNGGENYSILNSNMSELLYSIDFADMNTGVAVGDLCNAVRTTNGGLSWTPNRLILSTGDLRGIDFVNERIGYIAGGLGFASAAYIFKTTNAGENWTQLSAGTTNGLNCIDFLDSLNGLAGGGSIIMKTTNGGLNWYQTLFTGPFDFINRHS